MILAGVFQILLAVLGVTRLMRFIPRSVMVGFVNALAILVFMSQMPELFDVPWMVYPLVALSAWSLCVGLPAADHGRSVAPGGDRRPHAVHGAGQHRRSGRQDKGELPESLPALFIPNVPLTLETFQIIAPFALSMALVGLLESLMTAKLVDDITDTRSNKTRVSWGQGVANIVTGFLGGMGGCAVIGQTMINVKGSGARSRVSTFLAGVFLLVLVVTLGDVVGLIPMAALVAVMIFVSAITFDWHSVRPQDTQADAQVRDRCHAHHGGSSGGHAQPGDRRRSRRIGGHGPVRPAGGPLRDRGADGTRAQRRERGDLHGGRRAVLCVLQRPLHAVRVRPRFSARRIDRVIIDLHASHLWDASTIAVLDAVTEKYRKHGREVELIGLNSASVQMRERLAGKLNSGH